VAEILRNAAVNPEGLEDWGPPGEEYGEGAVDPSPGKKMIFRLK